MPQGTQFDGGRELKSLNEKDPLTGSLFFRLIAAVNRLANNAAVSPVGELPSPVPVNSINVQGSYNSSTNTMTVPSELLHATAVHNSEIQRGQQYIWEVDTDPNFSNPHSIDTGASRSLLPHSLPTKDGNGVTQNYFLRVTPQLHGSAPAVPTVFGVAGNPVKIVMTGSTAMSLLPSQGTGTAFPGQGGQGLGKIQFRPSAGPKRTL